MAAQRSFALIVAITKNGWIIRRGGTMLPPRFGFVPGS
jgi:hypothetical protein